MQTGLVVPVGRLAVRCQWKSRERSEAICLGLVVEGLVSLFDHRVLGVTEQWLLLLQTTGSRDWPVAVEYPHETLELQSSGETSAR